VYGFVVSETEPTKAIDVEHNIPNLKVHLFHQLRFLESA
jgi:hypothetical protein